jgi:hypothetical protein
MKPCKDDIPLIVENFISSMDLNLPISENMQNAIMDSRLYEWHIETLATLKGAIFSEYRKTKEKLEETT